jgi:ribosomal protein S18 acetylase RimI-like enzyme
MIHSITNHDRGNILDLLRQTAVFNEQEISIAMEIVDLVLTKQDRGDYQTFCYYDDNNQFMGYICFGPIPLTDFSYDLYWIAVDRKVQGKGVAEELVRFMEEQVARQGGRKIYVDTSATPLYAAARAFYKKQGYRAACVFDDFYREGDHKIIFIKDLGNNGSL